MADGGGFPVALQVSTSTLNDVIAFLQSSGVIPAALSQATPVLNDANGADPARLLMQMVVDSPRVSPMRRNDGLFGVDVGITANLTIDRQVGATTQHLVRLTLNMAAAAQADLLVRGFASVGPLSVPLGFDLNLRLTPVLVEGSDVVVLDNSNLTPGWRNFFRGEIFRTGLAFQLAQVVGFIPNALPPDATPVLSGLGLQEGMASAIAVPGQGFLTVAVSINTPSFASAGDVAQITDFRDGWDTALVLDPSTEGLLSGTLQTLIAREVTQAEVSDVRLRMKDGYFRISGHAEHDAASVDFSFRVKPKLGRPDGEVVSDDEFGQWTEYRPGNDDEIWIDVTHLQADVDLAWWVWLVLPVGWAILGPIGHGVGPGLITLINSLIMGAKVSLVSQVEDQAFPSRHQRIQSPVDPEVALDITVTSLKVRSTGTYARARIVLERPSTRLSGPTSVDVMAITTPSTYSLKFAPQRTNPADPSLMLRWRVWRGDTFAVVRDVEHGPGVDLWQPLKLRWSSFGTGHSGLDTFKIEARVFRNLDGEEDVVEVLTDTVKISDRLDRSHPYVRWTHPVWVRWVEKSNGVPVDAWWELIARNSQLHRTDVPGRCRFAASYARTAQLLYQDELGFDWDQLPLHRSEVCEYCFFGGPDKTTPLPKPDSPFNFPHQGGHSDPGGHPIGPKPLPRSAPTQPGAWLRRGRRPEVRPKRPPKRATTRRS